MADALQIAWYERGWQAKAASLLMGALATSAAIIVAYRSSNPSLAGPFAAAVIGGISIWMLTTARTHVTLAILMVYLGCADGVIKLMTNSSAATLGRDLLLYSIVAGLLVKRSLRRERFVAPPLTGWIVAFVVVVAVQVFNPGDTSLSHSVASTRPQLEFVPLFFLGYSMLQTRRRIKGFLLLLLVIAAANGVVGLVQFTMSPSQLASWGPGYAALINGANSIGASQFVDGGGVSHPRPVALGNSMGFGGAVGALAAPAALALLGLAGNRKLKILTGALSAGVVLAIVTSQARTEILVGVLVVIAYLLIATSSRRAFRVVLGIGIAAIIGYAVISVVASNTSSHIFDRYSSITPGKALSTTYSYRAATIADVPTYMTLFPLGAGIGKSGPAGNSAGGTGNYGLDAESEPTYLLIELGIPGLILLYAFQLRLLALSARIRRMGNIELRLLLAALTAPLFGLFISGWVGIYTATSPGGPYIWFVGGALTYWLIGARKRAEGAARASA